MLDESLIDFRGKLGQKLLGGEVYLKNLVDFMKDTQKGDSINFIVDSMFNNEDYFEDDPVIVRRKNIFKTITLSCEMILLGIITLTPLMIQNYGKKGKEATPYFFSCLCSTILLAKVIFLLNFSIRF